MHPVLRKLSTFATFSAEEVAAVESAFTDVFHVVANTLVAREDEHTEHAIFLLDGFICRQKHLPTGNRQILSFVLPGDGCDIGVSLLERRDHSLLAMTHCTLVTVSDVTIDNLALQYPRIRAALRWATMQREAIFSEWIVNVGQRMAIPRMAHLFCEAYYLHKAIGLVDGKSFLLPLTQTDLADVLGISAVHVNRSLQQLRKQRLVAFGDKRLTILDLARLEDLAGIDPTYLHLEARYHDGPKSARTTEYTG
jgi:CRP-like cAMP-binding protein